MSRPIYLAIMDASERGHGVSLSAAEVWELSQDDAIFTRAASQCEDDDEFVTNPNFTWQTAYREAQAARRKFASAYPKAGTTDRQPEPRDEQGTL